MNTIVSTYRLQMFKDFSFGKAQEILPYLKKLGISTLYLSPITKAKEGSTHGYDVVDPTQINPELGGQEGFEGFYEKVQNLGLNILLDIVPNHMAVSLENPWWLDILEHGPSSPYARFFDIDWNPTFGPIENRVLLPILGRPFGEALEEGEISVGFDRGSFWLGYFDNRLPLEPKSLKLILNQNLESFKERAKGEHGLFKDFIAILDLLEEIPEYTQTDPPLVQKRRALTQEVKQRILKLYETSLGFKAFLEEALKAFSGQRGNPESYLLLESLLLAQPYQVVFWQAGLREINFRRFFDINELVGVRVEEEDVLAASHALFLDLASQGKVVGLRVDHIDGLKDPEGYLKGLMARLEAGGQPCSVVVEKILAPKEWLPQAWPIKATTGYDFLNALNRVFIDPQAKKTLDGLLKEMNPQTIPFADTVKKGKRLVIETSFQSEVTALWYQLTILAKSYRYAIDLPLRELREWLLGVSVHMQVYRTYIKDFTPSEFDQERILEALSLSKESSGLEERGFRFMKDLLTLDIPPHLKESKAKAWLEFVMDWQQFSSPVMAKGYEDTALYNYPRLISLNEVGGDPDRFGCSPQDFHDFIEERALFAPGSLSASSTHDTKRSEDVRARVNVLSELPHEFRKHVRRWRRLLKPLRGVVSKKPFLDPDTELLFYQTLLGAWPLDKDELGGFAQRMKAYMVKAAKEAKSRTSWLNPDNDYERALEEFVEKALDPGISEAFLRAFLDFQPVVAFYGAINGLAQAVIKLTAPGIPDTYQGTELWDFSLVDPDNRRPVDYAKRNALLEKICSRVKEGMEPLMKDLLQGWEDGAIKLYTTWRLLELRLKESRLFLEGDYVPCQVQGRNKNHVLAFQRSLKDRHLLVAVPRLTSALVAPGTFPLGEGVWGRTALSLQGELPKRWENVLTGERLEVSGGNMSVGRLFSSFPLAVLLAGESKSGDEEGV